MGGATFKTIFDTFITYLPVNGAYTEPFAGLSPTLTMEKTWRMGGFSQGFTKIFGADL